MQDTNNQLYLFAPTQDVNTMEIGLQSSTSGLTVTPVVSGLSAQMGSDFFGLSRLDGSGTPLEQGVVLASASRELDFDPSHSKTAVALQGTSSVSYLVFVTDAAFFDPCGTCTNYIINPPVTATIRVIGEFSCKPGDSSLQFKRRSGLGGAERLRLLHGRRDSTAMHRDVHAVVRLDVR